MFIPRRRRSANLTLPQKLILYVLIGFISLIVISFIGFFVIFAWFAKDLPSPGKLSQTTGNSTVFYDREGKILYEVYKDKNRVPVSIKETSQYLKDATVSIEDKDFYQHKGISERGIMRAFINLVLKRSIQGGGSTITQQLIKNTLLDSRQTPSRKIKEIILAGEVERRYTKEQILEMYLNDAPYGGNFYGIGAGAKGYFGKDPKDLDIAESAFLAGLPQSPSYYSPFIGDKVAGKERAKDVLRRMREDKKIAIDQEKQALKKIEAMKFTTPKMAINAPHFVFYVKDLIEKEYGTKMLDQGLKVKTTLSLDIQNQVQDIVTEEIKKLADYNVGNGSVVVLDSKTGEVLAMVGSYDYYNEEYGAFNAATASRQPGSALKPIAYTLAFEKGYTPSTVLMDVKTVFPDQGGKEYIPVNYDGKFTGPVQLRFAVANSLNIPSVKLLAMIGLRDFLKKADELGIHSLSPTDANMQRFGLSIALGGGEVRLLDLTSAYSAFARGGTAVESQPIDEVKDFNGKIIYKAVKPKEKRVFSQESSFLISHILSDNVARSAAFGLSSYLNISGKTVAVKTGTTDSKKDNWAVGYTNSITVGVWTGNNDGTPMNPKIASGATGASSIWHTIMTKLLKKYEDGIMEKPDKVKAVTIDSYLGGLPKDSSKTRAEYFIEGTEPKDTSPFYKKLRISKSNGKLANDVESKLGQYDEKEFIVFTESDPVSTDGKNRWQEAIDAWVKEQKDEKYHPPNETSDASSDSVVVSIKSPNGSSTVNSNSVELRVKVSSVAPIKNVKMYINGNEIKNLDGDNKEPTETISLSDGVYEFKVVARNEKDKTGDSSIRFGVNKPWDSVPTESPTSTPAETATPTPMP